jgi:hypothetical protein
MFTRQDDESIVYLQEDRGIIEQILESVISLPIVAEATMAEEEVPVLSGSEEGPVVLIDNLNWQRQNAPLIRFAQVMATATGVRIRFVKHHSAVQVTPENEISICVHGRVNTSGAARPGREPEAVSLTFDGMAFPSMTSYGMLQPSRDGIVVEDDNGIPVAEVAHRKVGLLIDFSRLATAQVLGARVWLPMLAEKILSKAIDIALDENKCKTAQEEALSQRVKRQRSAYVNLVSARYNVALNDTKRQAEATARHKEELWQSFIQEERNLADLETRLESFTRNGAADDAAQIEFGKLCEIPEVIDLEISLEDLKFETSLIECTDPLNGRRYAIGEFEITLNLNGSVKFRNKTNSKYLSGTTWDHPHVKQGQPCFGNIKKMVATYLAKLEFGAVMQIIIMYLQTVNSKDTYGKNIRLWEDNRITGKKELVK